MNLPNVLSPQMMPSGPGSFMGGIYNAQKRRRDELAQNIANQMAQNQLQFQPQQEQSALASQAQQRALQQAQTGYYGAEAKNIPVKTQNDYFQSLLKTPIGLMQLGNNLFKQDPNNPLLPTLTAMYNKMTQPAQGISVSTGQDGQTKVQIGGGGDTSNGQSDSYSPPQQVDGQQQQQQVPTTPTQQQAVSQQQSTAQQPQVSAQQQIPQQQSPSTPAQQQGAPVTTDGSVFPAVAVDPSTVGARGKMGATKMNVGTGQIYSQPTMQEATQLQQQAYVSQILPKVIKPLLDNYAKVTTIPQQGELLKDRVLGLLGIDHDASQKVSDYKAGQSAITTTIDSMFKQFNVPKNEKPYDDLKNILEVSPGEDTEAYRNRVLAQAAAWVNEYGNVAKENLRTGIPIGMSPTIRRQLPATSFGDMVRPRYQEIPNPNYRPPQQQVTPPAGPDLSKMTNAERVAYFHKTAGAK